MERDPTGHKGTKVILLAFECKALTGCQGFSNRVLTNGFEWRRTSDVTLQDLHKKDLGPHEMCDRVAREGLVA